jgi:hypothetical protein
MSLNEVSNILWRERQLLELLVFKLEEEQLVLAAGRSRWLPHATREVESVLAEIKRLELDRAVHVDAVAADLGVGPGPTLRELVEHAPSPWNTILDDHRVALLEAAQEIDTIARGNRDLLARGQQAARAALDALTDHVGDGPVAGVYTRTRGEAPAEPPPVRLVDEVI